MKNVIITVIILFCFFASFGQLNSSAKSLGLFNVDSLTVQAEVTGLQLMYDSVAAIYYNTSSNKLRCYATGLGLGLFNVDSLSEQTEVSIIDTDDLTINENDDLVLIEFGSQSKMTIEAIINDIVIRTVWICYRPKLFNLSH